MKKLAVISDIHDNLANLDKALQYILKKTEVNYLIFTGDGQSFEVWQKIDQLPFPTFGAIGNADVTLVDRLKDLKNIKIFDPLGKIEIANRKIIFNHYPDIVKQALNSTEKKYDLALHGHTHQPWEEYYQGTRILNPGNIANLLYSPSFALIDLDDMKSKLIFLNEI
ncbi:MAG: hypothetical protein COV55_02300 [Candidatus Komeilibacteria bacterium CG11_big_fil_rev_8_21_14_0_20_36_20]|uniref:Phosphoesterase n=1 Tax=Candidatus Komeilibacteria bacterium CG11_big_fil_rev_8_21_14_0_20_36_20 TaxID=1974477 RepID=A0A2H0ND06_9BACT|nr:MAG: hypothetical protein COV55_02300 [Candidatus Komeilibacteria bacterium CG11_big_fil_rev_8_21_14_0_20_36_20]PIR81805.1 MAG: hypothetical protein COU21_01360 [Candidatus Komeilibacteria bacterium CG10_big_fil_rev_8_21_14_0_10_36_65]PJC55295.1 MAG: hypothetical protein CO027_02695 [Candidatus Komeilibacteria bacterium CG_4_9_14_0_2_um_filter_36_13]